MWLSGVLVCTAGSFLISLGLVLQKYSHLRERGWGGGSFYLQPWWVFGFSIYLAGQVLNFVAMAWAPQAMLSALGASSLVFLGFLAWIFLGESMERLEMLALACTVAGVIMVILAVPEAKGVHHQPATAVAGNLAEVDFLLTALACAAFLCSARGLSVLCTSGLMARGIFWTLLTGIVAGYTLTLWKCVSMLLLSARHTWVHWQIYVTAAIASVLCVVQVHSLNLALAMGSAKAVVPLTFALGVLIQIMNAQVAFEELSGMRRCPLFWVGVLLVLASIACIVQIQLSSQDEELALDEGEAIKEEGLAEEAKLPVRRSQTSVGPTGPTQISKDRRSRRHSSYFGLRSAAACRGRVFPLGGGGLVVVT
mmetsp:Transcript_58464/g.181561  ORF Transcript_58464/g.181561 Transcript_58464/m.181561 type:complete len:366 (-) Transcript_58464:189-1286(-)|eukprot:CAMPEP_0204582626 /NCGR_PEP_ID=MMETSP0661-20131031/45323_1 /ASSEMBLY_ACC=CAM_ASM_000606 /TAXON_ID=109239 /ORGANISM="Alexandrium margalefi, Strain AMGDE01CS-322" /LENGTH=365 /DNA_ID=CAMNT_0051591923 /DNA_START=129 /DNA_END=1226 /DNA_ORIENTATION=+